MGAEHGDEAMSGRSRTRREERKHSGHTRWRRFGGVMVLGGLASGALVLGMSQGAIAASFAASGTSFGVNAEELDGNGLTMYGSEVKSSDGAKQAATLGVPEGDISNFCTGFTVGKLPMLGKISIGLESPEVKGKDLLLDVGSLDAGTMELKKTKMGIDAQSVGGTAGTTGLRAGGVKATDLSGDTWSLSAGTMQAKGIKLGATVGDKDSCK